MRYHLPDALQRRFKKQIDEFVSGWTWDSVFLSWIDRLSDFSISLQPLFLEVPVHDPGFPTGRPAVLSWWPVRDIQSLHLALQRHLEHFPGTCGPVHPRGGFTRKGELETLDHLWRCRNDTERIAAVLIAASLFFRLDSSRGYYPRDEWPPPYCVEVLLDWAYGKWLDAGACAWSYYHTQVLPVRSPDYVYKLDTMAALVRYLAEEHVSVLSGYKPVCIVFGPERDPFVQRILAEEYEAERRASEERERAREREETDRQKEGERRKSLHARWGEWQHISDDELKRLVWSKPVWAVAKEFGVSDTAIAKRCRSAGIPRPPRGYWAQVAAGKRPHPKGHPPR